MKKIIFAAILFSASFGAAADYTQGYTRSNGTVVQGYERSAPNSTRSDNYGSQSNGGSQRDEYSSGDGATNRSNPAYGSYDNNNNGVQNAYDNPY